MSIQARFWSKVDVREPAKCWEWQAATNGEGYGEIGIDGESRRAHRVAFELENGPIDDKWVLHRCDNRLCVNPTHLYLGDHEDNMADARKHGEIGRNPGPRGEQNGNSKVTEDDVREIRARYQRSDVTQYDLAEEYGLSQGAVRSIVNHETWKHI